MGLLQGLNRLDARVLRSSRQPGEAAESYLRRVAGRRMGVGGRDANAVQQALREFFASLDAERR